jgi:HK97 family phage portal protein
VSEAQARTPEEVALAFWDTLFRKQAELSTTVPLNMDAGVASYPDVNYENFASEGYGKNEIVHACIRELATSAASPRYYVQAPSTDGGTVEIDRGLLYDLTSKPNPYSDWYSFIERLVTFLMVAGNAYAIKERSRAGQVSALYLLRPDRVTIVPGDYGAESYVYTVGGTEYGIEVQNMCHLALPNPAGDIYGLSPLQVAARTVNLDLNMTDFAKIYFQNAGVPSGLLKVKRRMTSQEEASTIRARWRSQFGGVNNFHRIAILDDDAEYQPMSNSPKDMELTGLHNLTESRICAVFGVPPILVGANVGLQRSTFSNYREARLAFHSETLEPMVGRILRYFNRNLFDEYTGNETLAVDWAAMRGVLDDQAATTTRLTALFAGGILTLNEARGELGFEAVTDGAIRRVPSSVLEVAEGQAAQASIGAAPVEQLHPARPEIKAIPVAPRARMLRTRLLEEREEETDRLVPELLAHFRGIRNRMDGILGRFMERQTAESKDYPFEVTDMLPPIETGNMENILGRAYRRVSERTFETINDAGVAGTVEWSDKLPEVQRLITLAPGQASIIHATTNKAISRSVAIGLERGYSIEQLARGVPNDNFPGLRSILTETDNRARMIARTEIMRTQNQTSIGFYRAQDFHYAQADDIDGGRDDYVDPGDPYGFTCAQRHGQIYRLEDAQNINDHPNGTLNWMPMPRGYRPEGGTDVPGIPVDRSDPFGPDFSASEWKPDVVLGAGVGTEARVGAVAAMRQTVANLKGNLGTYVAKLYTEKPYAVPQVVKRGSEPLQTVTFPKGAGGIYRPAWDTLHVAEGMVEHAMTHEIGHQITAIGGRHLVPMLGRKKANAFRKEIESAFNAAKKRGTREVLPGVKQAGSITEYAMTNLNEYMGEGFQFAMQKPNLFAGVDDELLRVMRKYLVTDKPVSFDAMLIRGGK